MSTLAPALAMATSFRAITGKLEREKERERERKKERKRERESEGGRKRERERKGEEGEHFLSEQLQVS